MLHSVFKPELSVATLTRYEVTKCNNADVYKNNLYNLTSLIARAEDYYCVPNNVTLALMGKYGAPINNHMHLRIAICKNKTENNNGCYPESVIRQKMASFFVSFIYKDSYIDAKDFLKPVKYYVTSNTLKSSSYNFRQDAYIYKNLTFESDSGYILPDVQTNNHVQLDSISSTTTGDMNTEVFTNVIIGLTNIKTTYHRSYVKVQDVSAQVGGIIKFFLIITDYLLSFYAYVPYLEAVYGSMFNKQNFNENSKENPPNIVNQSQFNIIQPTKQVNLSQNVVISNMASLKDLKRQRTNFTLKSKRLSFCEVLFRCFRVKKSSSTYAYLHKITTHYEANFDVAKILVKSQRISLLYDYTFNFKEREILDLHRRNVFLDDREQGVIDNNTSQVNHISTSLVFERLGIPRNLITTNQ